MKARPGTRQSKKSQQKQERQRNPRKTGATQVKVKESRRLAVDLVELSEKNAKEPIGKAIVQFRSEPQFIINFNVTRTWQCFLDQLSFEKEALVILLRLFRVVQKWKSLLDLSNIVSLTSLNLSEK